MYDITCTIVKSAWGVCIGSHSVVDQEFVWGSLLKGGD